jgi:malonyl-CoA/methylmalonyl-CoA synthetase
MTLRRATEDIFRSAELTAAACAGMPAAPMANPLFDALFAAAEPDALATETADRRFTYANLDLESARMANALVALGVRSGDRVAVQVEKSAANLILYLATLRTGAVYLPLNPTYTLAEVEVFLADAEPALVICDPAAAEGTGAIAAAVETLDAAGLGSMVSLAAAASDRFEPVDRAPSDLAAICYTSGTTGRAKGAMLTHANIVSNAQTLKALWRFSADDVLIHALPLFHVHGLFVATHVVMMAGGSMILQPRFDADAVVAAMSRATSLMGVPTFYTRLLGRPDLDRAAGMRLFICGSAPLAAQTHIDFEARTGHAILERYGMTETGMISSNPYDGERRAGTVGFPLPSVAVRIADAESGAPLEPGEVGVIEVKGPNVFGGYWRAAERTAAEFRPGGWFITGDLGTLDERGYLSIVGRAKDLIISGGLNIYPKEIEAVIDALPGVVECAVVGLPHADLGEAATAFVVADGETSQESLLKSLEGRLACFKSPKKVLLLTELPRNAMGKVQKATLRARYATLYDASPTSTLA